jgi:serine/threonine protein kinase
MTDSVSAPPPPTPPPSHLDPQELLDSLSVSLSTDVEMLANELRTCWRRGDRVSIELLGAVYDRIATHEELLLDAIYHEVLLREEFGENPAVGEYVTRFPPLAERLERLFAVHGAMESEWEDDPDADPQESIPDAVASGRQPSSTDWNNSPGGAPKRRRRRAAIVDAPPGYELKEELGRGGMAVVYRARQQNLDRIVALKMILGGAITSPAVLVRFEQEARTVAQLQHPGIVQIYEVGEHRGLPYLSLEYLAGGTLHDWLRGRPLPAIEAARLIERVARTVQFAHDRGVIHRDLKPANLLLTQRPSESSFEATLVVDPNAPAGDSHPAGDVGVKIADFGLARWHGTANNLTITGQVIGTPSYMAPEQARGAGDDAARPALDVYSLGAILYELLTGHPPFRGATLLDTLAQVRNDEPVSPRRLQPQLPRDLETICLKCLEKSPERRYAAAGSLADDLARFLKGQTITARPVMWPERVWKWMQRSPGVAALTAATVLFAGAGLTGIMEGARRAEQSANDARRDRDKADELWKTADEQRKLAETEQARAVAAHEEAERQRQLAEADKLRAIAARTEAESNFRSAMDAVNALTRLGQQLRYEPRQQATSRRIFDESLKFYEGFLTARSGDPALQYLAAVALLEAGDVRSDMGEVEKADELLTRAAGLLNELIEHEPSNLTYRWSASRIAHKHGHLNRRRLQPEAAEENYLTGIVHLDAILAANPTNAVALVEKSNAILNRCVVLQFTGRLWEAQRELTESVRIMRQVVAQQPHNDYFHSELARSLDDLGKYYWLTARPAECEPFVREALQIREQLYQRRSNQPGYCSQYARSLSFVGQFESDRAQFDAAKALLQKAIEILGPLLADYPEIYEYWAELHVVHVAQLRIAVRQKGLAGMDAEWRTLKAFLDRACQQFPEDRLFQDRQSQSALRYAFVLWDTPTASSLLKSARDYLPQLGTLPPSAIEAPRPEPTDATAPLNE